MTDRAFTVLELAELTGVPGSTIRRMARAGQLRVVQKSPNYLIGAEAVGILQAKAAERGGRRCTRR